MWEWYKDAVEPPPPTSRLSLSAMTEEREDLYWHVPPPGEPIPVGDLPFSVDDGIPEDEAITWAVRKIRLNRSCSPSVMQAEHLRQWLIAAMRDDAPDSTNWLKVVAIVHTAFCYRTMAEECTWQIVVLITK